MIMELQEIIDRLYIRFPNIIPTKEISIYELGKIQGNQLVISYLKELLLQPIVKKK